jgi:cell division transport system ATP-binding protein
MSVVRMDKVGLRYGTGAEVLSDVDLRLDKGSFHVLVGSSGAGKTSLMKLVYLAQRPTRGALSVFGEDVVAMPRGGLPALRRRIGVVYQDFRLVPHLSTFDNVALPLRIAGADESRLRAHVEEMLAWVGLSDRMTALPAILSGGEQQRVVIGRPDLLVADEPTGNVDPEMASRLIHLFHELNRLGTTILVATHDAHLLASLPDVRMLRLERGRVSEPYGAPRRVEA